MRSLRNLRFFLLILCLYLSTPFLWVDNAYPSDGKVSEKLAEETVPEVKEIRVEDVKSNEIGWVKISWQPLDVSGLDHYLIYRSEIGSGREKYDLKVIGWTDKAWFVDKNSKNDSEYFYGVTAVDKKGNEGEN